MTLTQCFEAIGDAIREKTGDNSLIAPVNMANAINSINTGGGDPFYYTVALNNGGEPEDWAGFERSARVAAVNAVTFNSPVIFGEGLTSLSNAFYGCETYDQPTTFPNGVRNLSYAFAYCNNFNTPFNIPDSVVEMHHALREARNFNHPLTIPKAMQSLNYALENAKKFNADVTFESGGTEDLLLCGLFDGCTNFNRPISFPDRTTLLSGTLRSCYNFNQPLTIPSRCTNVSGLFEYSPNFNQPLTIPASVTNAQRMLAQTNSNSAMSSDIYIDAVYQSLLNVYSGMLKNHNVNKRINVFCNNLSLINQTAAKNSLTNAAISWTATTNGYYNAAANIYIFSNYIPGTGPI